MATRQTSVKIPRNKRVPSKDAVVPTVKGMRGVIPSTLGVQDRARFGKYVKSAESLIGGVAALMYLRKFGNAELEALARNPGLLKKMDAAISELGAGVDSLVREYNATSSDDPEALAAGSGTQVVNTPSSGDPAAVSGQDAAWQAFAAEAIRHREAATKRANEIRFAANAVNPARIRMGLADDVDLDPVGSMQRMFGSK